MHQPFKPSVSLLKIYSENIPSHTQVIHDIICNKLLGIIHLPIHVCVGVLVAQSCVIVCDPMVCILPGSSVHGILQARMLEWVAIPFSNAHP